MSFITVLQNTENARVVGEFKGLTLATTVWYEIFASFHFCIIFFFLQFLKQIPQYLFKIPNRQNIFRMLRIHKVREPRCLQLYNSSVFKDPSLINSRLSCSML